MQRREPNNLLRQQRIQRGWSQARLAEQLQNMGGAADSKLVGKWERGIVRPSPFYREKLCLIYGVTADQSGLAFGLQRDISEKEQERSAKSFQPLANEALTAMANLENEGLNMDHSRRSFLQLLGCASFSLSLPKEIPIITRKIYTNVSDKVIEGIATITQNYRVLQRAGFAMEEGLRNHIALIQSALEYTPDENYRRELWRSLAQSQLLARHSVTKQSEFMRARTWNESAIASAQYSGDKALLGAALGHLGHLYFSWSNDPGVARQLLEQAQTYAKGHPVNGWLVMVLASISAGEAKKKQCEASIDYALEIASGLPKDPNYADLYYTDFNIAGVRAFSGNCFLKIGEPAKALENLLALDLETFSKNRHASAFHDISCAYIAMGELEAAESYAVRSIDAALATNRDYIIYRFIALKQKMQQKYPNDTHAASISAYAHHALETGGTHT